MSEMSNGGNNGESAENADEEYVHPVFKNDPIKLFSYVNKEVEVKVNGGKVFRGWVKTIDPVSESVVLVNFLERKPVMIQIIMGHTIEFINIVCTEEHYHSQLESLFQQEEELCSKEDVNDRKNRLKLWLIKNRLPVKEIDDTLEVAECMKILPPYGTNQCFCTNEIILGKIQGLITSMPKTHDDS
ncbi:gem-associated protein 6-like [Centruroides vittatus]|uniref:gem-associated protein 6-like n=1 Tax=Centruroides vittatus TaxID=120091 RepID=UPI0035100C1C